MKLLRYFGLLGLSSIVACVEPPLTVTLGSSELNPTFNSSVTLTATATPVGKILSLELLELDATGRATLVKSVSANTLTHSVSMGVAGSKQSFVARVTDSSGTATSSAVIDVSTQAVLNLQSIPSVVAVFNGATRLIPTLNSASSRIAEVEFFEGTTLLGKVNSAPFEFLLDEFKVAGSRVFNVVATDTNGLKVRGDITVKVEPIILESVSHDVFLNVLLSPDFATLRATYKTGGDLGIGTLTNWSILKEDGSPAPTDSSFGFFQAIPGEANGLQSSRIRYIPPADKEFAIRILAEHATIAGIKNETRLLEITPKGTIEELRQVTFVGDGVVDVNPNRVTLRVGQFTEFSPFFLGIVGDVDSRVFFANDAFNAIGTIGCRVGECVSVSGLLQSNRFRFTATRVGSATALARSVHNLSLGATVNITVIP
ncbi:MAG: hypothetical protein RLZZ156_1448 [Deinococcota bacterium]|jgi:hypothetical protein